MMEVIMANLARSLSFIGLMIALVAFVGCAEESGTTEEGEPLNGQQLGQTEGALETDNNWYSNWDADTSDPLNQEEFAAGFEEEGFFDDWDMDNDTYLSEEEFNDAFGDEEWFQEDGDWFNTWDANSDDQIDEDELSTGLFDTWNENDNEALEQNEFDSTLFQQ